MGEMGSKEKHFHSFSLFAIKNVKINISLIYCFLYVLFHVINIMKIYQSFPINYLPRHGDVS